MFVALQLFENQCGVPQVKVIFILMSLVEIPMFFIFLGFYFVVIFCLFIFAVLSMPMLPREVRGVGGQTYIKKDVYYVLVLDLSKPSNF